MVSDDDDDDVFGVVGFRFQIKAKIMNSESLVENFLRGVSTH